MFRIFVVIENFVQEFVGERDEQQQNAGEPAIYGFSLDLLERKIISAALARVADTGAAGQQLIQ